MTKPIRIAAVLLSCAALTLGISSVLAKPVGRPLPPPPVLCGCVCPDGSFITTHAAAPNDCDAACDAACAGGSGEF